MDLGIGAKIDNKVWSVTTYFDELSLGFLRAESNENYWMTENCTLRTYGFLKLVLQVQVQ